MLKCKLFVCLSLVFSMCFNFVNNKPAEAAATFAKGADVGWLSEMEYYNWSFYNDNDVKQDLLQILKEHGLSNHD